MSSSVRWRRPRKRPDVGGSRSGPVHPAAAASAAEPKLGELAIVIAAHHLHRRPYLLRTSCAVGMSLAAVMAIWVPQLLLPGSHRSVGTEVAAGVIALYLVGVAINLGALLRASMTDPYRTEQVEAVQLRRARRRVCGLAVLPAALAIASSGRQVMPRQ